MNNNTMVEKIRVLTPIEVPNLDHYVDTKALWIELNSYVKAISHRINLQDLDDWRLLINVNSMRTDASGVAKRVRRYPSDKEFDVSISISIPDDDLAAYGLPCVKEGWFTKKNEKYSYIIEPDFDAFENMYQYILESAKRAIDLAFTHGFTCNGKRIKFTDTEKMQ